MTLGDIIKKHRAISGLTQQELAKLAGIGKTAIFDMEHGVKSPRFDTLQKVCEVLNLKIKFESHFVNAEVKREES